MILAAGLGARMRPLTDHTPKPLLAVADKAMVSWQIESLVRAGFTDITINTSHHAHLWLPIVEDARCVGAKITLLHEGETPFESLGGICNMLRHLPAEQQSTQTPFVVASGDVFTDFDYGSLVPILQKIEAGEVDAHFVLADNPPFHPTGDFAIKSGLATRAGPRLNFAGITCWHPKVFCDVPVGTHERLFPWADTLVAHDRVSAAHYRGLWENIGTPEQLASLQKRLGAKMT
jgi:MurNAc alpha-1-phosphate uridylyltransferase